MILCVSRFACYFLGISQVFSSVMCLLTFLGKHFAVVQAPVTRKEEALVQEIRPSAMRLASLNISSLCILRTCAQAVKRANNIRLRVILVAGVMSYTWRLPSWRARHKQFVGEYLF